MTILTKQQQNELNKLLNDVYESVRGRSARWRYYESIDKKCWFAWTVEKVDGYYWSLVYTLQDNGTRLCTHKEKHKLRREAKTNAQDLMYNYEEDVTCNTANE